MAPRIDLLIKTKQADEAWKAAEEAISKGIEADDSIALAKLSALPRARVVNDNRALLELSLKAAKAWLQLAGEKNMFALWNLAELYFALGDRVKAKEYGAKAIAAGEGETEQVRKYIQQQIKKFDEEKKDK